MILKNKFLRFDIDEYVLNRRVSYLMHDHSVKKYSNADNFQDSYSANIHDIDKAFSNSIENSCIAKLNETAPN